MSRDTHYGDPLSYAFGYAISAVPKYWKKKLNDVYKFNNAWHNVKDMYNRTDLDAYEYRKAHEHDPIIGYMYQRANLRDYNAEIKQKADDRQKNLGYSWKDTAYPRISYGSLYGDSAITSRDTPLFEVNQSILDLYNGAKKLW